MLAERDAAPADCASQARLPGGAGDPPGDTTIPCDRFADGWQAALDLRECKRTEPPTKSAAPVTEKRCGGAPGGGAGGERPSPKDATPQGVREKRRAIWCSAPSACPRREKEEGLRGPRPSRGR